MAEVSLQGVTKTFGDEIALDNVTMTVPDGSFVVLLGPTGAGKTTTLRMVSGLDTPDTGKVMIGGVDMAGLTPAQRDVTMVFQQYSLYPHLTVRQNLEFPLKSPILRTPQNVIDQKIGEVAEVLQISHKLDNKATALSGGEMQRVSIGRALVRQPSVYLMDEPLSSLDAKLRSDLRVELKNIQANSGATLLYVTHDQIEAMTMATHVGVLDNGKLIQFGFLSCDPFCEDELHDHKNRQHEHQNEQQSRHRIHETRPDRRLEPGTGTSGECHRQLPPSGRRGAAGRARRAFRASVRPAISRRSSAMLSWRPAEISSRMRSICTSMDRRRIRLSAWMPSPP